MAGATGRPIADEPPAGHPNRWPPEPRGTVPDTPYSDELDGYTDQQLDGPPDDDLEPGVGGDAGDDENYVYLPPESSLTRRILLGRRWRRPVLRAAVRRRRMVGDEPGEPERHR